MVGNNDSNLDKQIQEQKDGLEGSQYSVSKDNVSKVKDKLKKTLSEPMIRSGILNFIDECPNKMIDFHNLNKKFKELNHELIFKLDYKSSSDYIIDYFDNPEVNNFLERIYDQSLNAIEESSKHLDFSSIELAREIWMFLKDFRAENFTVKNVEKILKINTELTVLFTFNAVNNEILRILIERYCMKFGRDCFQDLLDRDNEQKGNYHRFLFHPSLSSYHYLLKSLVKSFEKEYSHNSSSDDMEKCEPSDVEPLGYWWHQYGNKPLLLLAST